jgi:PKD repeat protein
MANYTFGLSEELQFNTQDTELTHTWDFGDGSPISSVPNPTHIYTAEGIYIVTHSSRDFCGTCISASHTVEIVQASITVRSILLDKYTAKVGDIVTVTIIAQNLSLVYGTGTVVVKFDTDVIQTFDVTLNSGQETSLTTQRQITSTGTINVCADNICTVLFVESQVSVKTITLDTNISTGNPIFVTIDTQNLGTFTESKRIQTTLTNTVTVVIDDRVETVPPGGNTTYQVPISVTGLPNGVYTICAENICKAISVAVPTDISGSIAISSVPTGAEIFIDGQSKGVYTNTTISGISPGAHTFTLKLAGYNDTNGDFTITAGMTTYIYMALSPTTPTTGSLSISSFPTGAEIWIDGVQQLDTNNLPLITPATVIDLTPTDYNITLKLAGYLDYDTIVSITAGQTEYLSVPMAQAPILVGSINFTTIPDGAEILIDGSNTGKVTPDTIKDASIGLHSFTLVKDGYDNILGQIDVIGGITSYIYAVMVPIAPTVGGISIISTPPGADIYLDGNVQPATTPATIPNLTPGTHSITLKLSGYEDFTRSINIIAGITTYLDTILTPIPITIGSINFTSSPIGAQIWLDGSNTGRTTPYTLTNISVGPHTFILKLDGYNDTTGSITVIGGAISTYMRYYL